MKRKILAGILAATMICSLTYVGNAKADTGEKETIARLDYAYTDEQDVEVDPDDAEVSDLNETKYGNKKDGYRFTEGEARLFASITGDKSRTLEWCQSGGLVSDEYKMGEDKEVEPVMTASNKNPWTADTIPYFEVQLSTLGYENVDFSAFVGASKKGPKDFQLSYAVGSAADFTRLGAEEAKISLSKNKKMTEIAGVLPESANDQQEVRVRIEIVTLEAQDQSAASGSAVMLTDNPASGEAAVNHIRIKGDRIARNTAPPDATEPASAASPSAPMATESAPAETTAATGIPSAPAATEAAEEKIARLDYTYHDAGDVEVDETDDTVSDLNEEKYGNKTDGYRFTEGSARLYASITADKYKTLEWSKDGNDKVAAEYKMGEGTEAEPVMASTKKNPWTEGRVPYFEVEFDTLGYENVGFSAYIGASKKGPKDYQLSYAAGSSEVFTRLEEESAKVTLTENKKMTKIAGTLPAAADNQEKVRVRIEIVTMETVDQSNAADGKAALLTDNPKSGEAAINHIAVCGKRQAGVTPRPTATAAPASAEPTVSASAVPVAPGPSETKEPDATMAPTATETPSGSEATALPTTVPVPTETTQATVTPAGSDPQPTATPAGLSRPTAAPGTVVSASPAPTVTVSQTPKPEKDEKGKTKIVVKNLKLNKKKINIKKGKKYQLKVSFQVSGTTKAKVKNALKWTSSNKKVAAVTKKGKVKAKKKGNARITVKYKKQKAVCKVKVKK